MNTNILSDLIVVFVFRPLIVMWAWNELTPYDIDYSFWNWLAVIVITATFARPLHMAVYPYGEKK